MSQLRVVELAAAAWTWGLGSSSRGQGLARVVYFFLFMFDDSGGKHNVLVPFFFFSYHSHGLFLAL